MRIFKLIDIAGFTAFGLLVAGFLLGILDMSFLAHKYIGMAAVAFASIHLGLILYQRARARKMKEQKPTAEEGV